VSFGVPWALVGLAALPLVWWLHRRLRRPPEQLLPSLMFLQDEDETRALPRGRRLDAELLLALSAACLLALAAAGPRIVRARAHRVIRVVVSGGTAATARGYSERVSAVLADIRAGMDPEDVLVVTHEPAPPEEGVFVPRPTADALLAAARAGESALRVVVSDLGPPAETGGVHWVAAGEPRASNLGIVALSAAAAGEHTEIFFTVANHGLEAESVWVGVRGSGADGARRVSGGTRLKIPPRGMSSGTLVVSTKPTHVLVSLGQQDRTDLEDDLRADDRVALTRAPLGVYLHEGVPAEHAVSVRRALQAALGTSGVTYVDRAQALAADLAFVPVWAPLPSQAWILTLQPVVEGEPVEHAGRGGNPRGRDPIVRDLSAAGVDWVYAPGAAEVGPGESVLLRRSGTRDWPIVLRRGRRLRLAADPLRGEPAAADTPFWPLLVENLTRLAGGAERVGAGYRARGLLDPETSRPGRARSAFDPDRLAAAVPSVPAEERSLRRLLIVGALLCLATLWSAPRLRRRFAHGRSEQRQSAASA